MQDVTVTQWIQTSTPFYRTAANSLWDLSLRYAEAVRLVAVPPAAWASNLRDYTVGLAYRLLVGAEQGGACSSRAPPSHLHTN